MNRPVRSLQRTLALAHRGAASVATALALVLAAGPCRADEATANDNGLRAVAALAQLNGQALACQDQAGARRAKALMLAHAPKTARYGQAYDDGTQQAYLAHTRGQLGCPDAPALAARLDAVAQQLKAALPASAAAP